MQPNTVVVHLKVDGFHDNGNGTLSIHLKSRSLDPEEVRILGNLFPTLIDQAHRLLDQECLLASVASEADLLAKPIKKYKAGPDTRLD